MPALPAVANTLRVQLKHTLGSDTDVLTRLYFLYSGTAPTSAGLNTMASTIVTNWASAVRGLFNSGVTLTEVVIEDLSSSTAAAGSATGSTAGNRSGNALPAQCAVLINYSIARRYRGGKPRNYIPAGVQADLASPQTWTSGFLSAVATDWATFVSDIIAAAPSGTTISGQVSVSYYEGFTNYTGPTGRMRARSTVKSGAELPIVPDAIASTSVNPKVATQRRRTGQKR